MKSSKKQKRNGKISNLLLNKKSVIENQDTKTKSVPLLIDGSILVYMAFYSTGHLSYNGRETGIIFGFLKNILSLAKRFETNNFIFCWDSSASHRKKIYPDYKKKRKENREQSLEDKIAYGSLILQKKELSDKILPALGFKNNFVQDGFEGDDLLAYWALKLKRCIMITTDVDMYQCLNRCDIWNPRKKKFFTKKHLIKEFGVNPNQWSMAKAIGGCGSDSVIGISGISDPKSPKSKSLKYLQDELSKGAILNKIESKEGQRIIKRNLPLVTLPFFHELYPMTRMIIKRNTFNIDKFFWIFDGLHFKSFLEKDNFEQWKKSFLS